MARKSTTASAPKKTKATAPESAATTEYPPDVVLRGRLVADPVLRHTQNGKPVSTIRIAVNKPNADTTFHDIVVWNRTAEVVCQYLKKGRLVEVTGREQDRNWVDKDGNPRTTNEVSAYRVQFVSEQRSQQAPEQEQELS
ncbi:MAG: single-stranded DNA-binding protein [Solirubrobacterales bacterium]